MDTAQSGSGGDDPPDSTGGWIAPAFVAIAVVMIIGALVADLWPRHPVVLTQAAALLLFITGWTYGRKASYRGRVFCLIVVFMGLVLQFSVFHALLADRNPESFRVADTLLDSRLREELGQDRASILTNARLLFAATVLESEAAAVHAAVGSAAGRSGPGGAANLAASRPLTGGITFHYRLHRLPTAEGDLPSPVDEDFMLTGRAGELVASFSASSPPTPSFAPEAALGLGLARARNAAAIAKAAREFAGRVEARQARTVQHMHGIVRREPRLDISHYVYFSATVMTTIGTADLAPATRAARWMVTLQALVAVFFLGFAINFLWPAPGDRIASAK